MASALMEQPFIQFTRLSPHRAKTPAHECKGVCFHHSVMDFDATIALLSERSSRVSYHAIIALNGTRCTLVPDAEVAWHAGVSAFEGRQGCNAFLLGLAFAGDTYQTPLTPAQVASALEWLAVRWQRYGWTLDAMTDHRQIAPARKDDLAPREWDRLHAAIAARFSPPRQA